MYLEARCYTETVYVSTWQDLLRSTTNLGVVLIVHRTVLAFAFPVAAGTYVLTQVSSGVVGIPTNMHIFSTLHKLRNSTVACIEVCNMPADSDPLLQFTVPM